MPDLLLKLLYCLVFNVITQDFLTCLLSHSMYTNFSSAEPYVGLVYKNNMPLQNKNNSLKSVALEYKHKPFNII